MSYNQASGSMLPSLYGRRIGLMPMTSAQTGTGRTGLGAVDFLVGPEDLRKGVTTAESTGVNLTAWGISNMAGTSAGSSSVYVLDPPIPGVRKALTFLSSANGNMYVRTLNSETIQTTFGSSFTTIKSTGTGMLELLGVTTAIWASAITSGTTANAAGFALTTTT